ncbi:MAG: right-handed parallel beta-helix repeat-containing protein [Lentisphaeria bacterium]|jgi:hypothetical protein
MKMLPFALSLCVSATAATYYVDSSAGNDAADGLSPQTAWQSLAKVNRSPAQPGDQVLFKRGGLWRGALRPGKGSLDHVTRYADYGEGPLPIIQGSVAADAPALWEQLRPGLWRTTTPTIGERRPLDREFRTGHWACYFEADARAHAFNHGGEKGHVVVTLNVSKAGTHRNHIQLWGPVVPYFEDVLIITLRARSKMPIKLKNIDVLQEQTPWRRFANGRCDTELRDEWQEIEIVLNRISEITPEPMKLHFGLGDQLRDGEEIQLQVLKTEVANKVGGLELATDVGNIIFDHGEACGWKKWGVDQLDNVGDYYYAPDEQCVYLRYDGNPAELHKSIELAMRGHVVNHGGRKNILFENLAIRYGASHGFGGGSSERITIRGCDLYYIGGAHQFTRPDGKPVRFGNGIEFWGDAKDNLVENCRLWEIYDAALTNQGREDTEVNITYRNNVIWNAEFSFEYWNRKLTENITFVNNTCVDAGYGWAHAQRPDPNGAHLMFYSNRAKTRNFIIKDNIFVQTTHAGMRMDLDWLDVITLDYNLWHVGDKPIYRLAKNNRIMLEQLPELQKQFPVDVHSQFGMPVFMDAAKRDYRLAPDSIGRSGASDGGPFGARARLKD